MSETETDQEENKKPAVRKAIPENLRLLKSMESLLRKQSKMLKQLVDQANIYRSSSDEDEDVPLKKPMPKPKKPAKKRKVAN
jgi:hypothetical protein